MDYVTTATLTPAHLIGKKNDCAYRFTLSAGHVAEEIGSKTLRLPRPSFLPALTR